MSMIRGSMAMVDPQLSPDDCKLLADALALAEPPSFALERLMMTALVVELPVGPVRHPRPDWPVRALWLLRRGEIALGDRDRHGDFTEIRRLLPGEWVDVFGGLSARPAWFHDMMALRDSEALALPLSGVMQLMCADPAVGHAFGQVMSTEAQHLRDGQRTLRSRSFGARLASRMLDETAGCGNEPQRRVWTMGMRKRHLAQQLDVSSETLSRGLRALCDAGVILVRGYDLEVLDRGALAEIARSGNLP